MDVHEGDELNWFVMVDGDRVGDSLDAASIAGDHRTLVQASRTIDAERDVIARRIRQASGEVILSVASLIVV